VEAELKSHPKNVAGVDESSMYKGNNLSLGNLKSHRAFYPVIEL
jgi:hypothetical protein